METALSARDLLNGSCVGAWLAPVAFCRWNIFSLQACQDITLSYYWLLREGRLAGEDGEDRKNSLKTYKIHICKRNLKVHILYAYTKVGEHIG